jgi:hypothetical protein
MEVSQVRKRLRMVSVKLVGVAGFEPATPTSRTWCSTRLSHTPPPVASGSITASSSGRKPIKGSERRLAAPRLRAAGEPSIDRRAMGRSQVVRQRILIPPYGGSNPPAPANFP